MARTPEQEYARLIRDTAQVRALSRGFRGVLVRSRLSEANVNVTQLTARTGDQLRVLAEEADGGPAGATADDIGKFLYVPGYSVPGGPDFIPS